VLPTRSSTCWQLKVDPERSKFRGNVREKLKFKNSGEVYMGVSKNRGTPKWIVYNGKPY